MYDDEFEDLWRGIGVCDSDAVNAASVPREVEAIKLVYGVFGACIAENKLTEFVVHGDANVGISPPL